MFSEQQQKPVAVHQFRSPHCADWYDGVPDQHDGHGPYETRTLYTAPPDHAALLAALRVLLLGVWAVDAVTELEPAVHQARAAIAKATGVSA